MSKKDDFKKVGAFLKGLTPTEYRYMELTMQMVSGFRDLISRFELSKEDFCKKFEISVSKYDDYVKGNYNYSVEDMIKLQFVFADLEAERLRSRDMIKVTLEE